MIYDIGIVDTKKIIASIKETYGYDFSNFALTTLKRRFLKILNENNYSSLIDFINHIENNQKVFENYLSQGLIDTTEMFRDPSFWREMRDKYLPYIYKDREFKVYIPGVTSGEDLYTTLIVLKELNMLEHAKVLVTSISSIRLEKIKNGGMFDSKKIEVGEANYKRFKGKNELNSYYEIQNNKIIMDQSLLKNVTFKEHTLLKDEQISGKHIVLYRNRLLYFNPTLHEIISEKLLYSLLVGGILCLGSRETLNNTAVNNKFILLNKDEQIYKKRLD